MPLKVVLQYFQEIYYLEGSEKLICTMKTIGKLNKNVWTNITKVNQGRVSIKITE